MPSDAVLRVRLGLLVRRGSDLGLVDEQDPAVTAHVLRLRDHVRDKGKRTFTNRTKLHSARARKQYECVAEGCERLILPGERSYYPANNHTRRYCEDHVVVCAR